MSATAIAPRRDIETLSRDLEDLWRCLDELFADLSPSGWSRKHGKHWIFADLPYHLAYLDRECIQVMAQGGAAPPAARWLMHSEAEVDAWNATMFAQRPVGQTVVESLAQMQASRELIRQTLAGLTDADLDRPAWSPFFGWVTLRDGIGAVTGHTFNHFMEARLRLKRSSPVPPSALIHRALGFYLGLLERFLDRERAASRRLTAVMAFSGPGGGAWTIRVEDGRCRVSEERAADADLVMTQSPEAFVATFARVKHPMLLMLTGQIKVKGFGSIGTFGKLFPSPAANPERGWPVVTELVPAAA